MLKQLEKDALLARKEAIKSKELAVKSTFLNTLLAEVKRVGFDDGKRATTDAEMLQVVQKFIKNAKETINIAPNSDNAKQAANEIIWLESYLPKQLTENELLVILTFKKESLKEHNSPINMGVLMTYLKEHYAGQYDAKSVSILVKKVLEHA